jgi:PAS domain S-box-containing protein
MGFENAASLIGLNGFSFVHPDDRPMIIERAQQLVQKTTEGILPRVKQRLVHPDGRIVTIESTTSRIRFNGRDAILVIAREIAPDPV